ncbi:MAG TPA: hypothetical protein VMC07_02225 [Candidatus Omnitrophota bacterium]|nr:hypothetical protein [Candidatus Omnitrophota bacterium]
MGDYKEICKLIAGTLTRRGYFISPNYGLILKTPNDETAIADIRISEGKVVLPYWNEIETEDVKGLKKILLEEQINFRDGQNQSG